jgi:hypothetical protein
MSKAESADSASSMSVIPHGESKVPGHPHLIHSFIIARYVLGPTMPRGGNRTAHAPGSSHGHNGLRGELFSSCTC